MRVRPQREARVRVAEVLGERLDALPRIQEHGGVGVPGQFHALAPLLQRAGVRVRYLGWLRRPQLWKAFTEHDVLIMPSTTLEAMGLVAL